MASDRNSNLIVFTINAPFTNKTFARTSQLLTSIAKKTRTINRSTNVWPPNPARKLRNMTNGETSDDDLYRYDGPRKPEVNLNDWDSPQLRRPRQDSAIDFSTIADVTHLNLVGTLFTPQGTVDSASQIQSGSASARLTNLSVDARLSTTETELIADLRRWFDNFELPQSHADSDENPPIVDGEPSFLPRKRSLSVRTAKVVLREFAPPTSTEHCSDFSNADTVAPDDPVPFKDDESNFITLEESSASPLFGVLSLPPIEGTPEWEEARRVQEEYEAIERVRADRIAREEANAEFQESYLKMVARDWEAEKLERRLVEEKGWERERAKMASNLALFDSLIRNDGTTAMFDDANFQPMADEGRDDVKEDLDYRDYLIRTAKKRMRKDTKKYVIPRPWSMADRDRRIRLYSNINHLERYLRQEEKLVPLIEERLEFLHEGRSEQREDKVVAEIKVLEPHLAVHIDDESNRERLVYDFLRWAADQMTIDMQQRIEGTLAPGGPAFSDSLSRYMMRFIKSFPRLRKGFQHIRDFEKLQFPDRFTFHRQLQPQFTPRGRPIPIRQPQPTNIVSLDDPPQSDGSLIEENFGHPLERVDSHQNDPKASRTLPRSFKARTGKVLELLARGGEAYFPVPTLDRKMEGEPTSPVNPPLSDYFRPPKPKREIPLQLACRPGDLDPSSSVVYIPPPTPFLSKESASLRSWRNFQADEKAFRRRNPPRRFLSLKQAKRHRALQEPLTPETVDQVVERNWAVDRADTMQRMSNIEEDVHRNHLRHMFQLTLVLGRRNLRSSRLICSEKKDGKDIKDAESSERVLRIVSHSPTEHIEATGSSQTTKSASRIDKIQHIETLENNKFLRIVNVNQSGNTESIGAIDPAHLIGRIEDIEPTRIIREPHQNSMPAIPPSECPTSSLVQNVEKEIDITATEIGGYDTEDDESLRYGFGFGSGYSRLRAFI